MVFLLAINSLNFEPRGIVRFAFLQRAVTGLDASGRTVAAAERGYIGGGAPRDDRKEFCKKLFFI
jgi:hypothetical protein